MAYLIHANHWTLSRAYAFVLERRKGISPNIGFVSELMTFEEQELGGKSVGVVKVSSGNGAHEGEPANGDGEGGHGHGHGHGGGHGSGPGPSPPSSHPTVSGALPGPPGASPQQQQQQRPWSPPAIQGRSPNPSPFFPFSSFPSLPSPSSSSFLQPFEETLTADIHRPTHLNDTIRP